jgi:hypothetical protein
MTNETLLYYYERTRKQQAKVLAFNMLFLPFILWLILLLARENQADYEQFLVYLKYIFVIAELVLLSLVVWFLTHPSKFYIKLTKSEFSSFHPIFKAWTFSVSPKEIVEIEQSSDREAESTTISIKLVNGSSYSLSPNYAYSRKKLYQALRLLNPNIKTPKNTWLFSYKR